jgi:hypothetical protein
MVRNVEAIVVTIPELSNAFYISLPQDATSFNLKYFSSNDKLPAIASGDNLFKILVPPGVSKVIVSGEAGSFTDQFAAGFDSDVSTQMQSCVLGTDCFGKQMQRITGALSTVVFDGTPFQSARYMTLVIKNTTSTVPFLSFSITMEVKDVASYGKWWAAEETKQWKEVVFDIGSFFPINIISRASATGTVKCSILTTTGNKSIGCDSSSSVAQGESITLTAEPANLDSKFAGWECTGAILTDEQKKSPSITVVQPNTPITCDAIFGAAFFGDITNQPVKATLIPIDFSVPNGIFQPAASSGTNLVNVFTRLDELPSEGFKWVDIGTASPFANVSDIPNGILPNNVPVTMNATLALPNGVSSAEAVVIAAMDGNVYGTLKYKKRGAAASFDFTNPDVWGSVMLNDFDKTDMAYKTFSAEGSKTYSVLVGAGNIKLPRENSSVWLFSGYRTKINGTYRYTLGFGATPINVTPAYDMVAKKGITAYVPSVGTTEQITECKLKDTTTAASTILLTVDTLTPKVTNDAVLAIESGLGKYACTITVPATSGVQWADVTYTTGTAGTKTVSIKVVE